MTRPAMLSEADHLRVSQAVARAEEHTSGEIVTIVTERSDGYTDIVLAWAVFVAITALTVVSIVPDFYLGMIDRMLGHWQTEWTPGRLFILATAIATLKFAGALLILLWKPLRYALIPAPIKHRRVRARALTCFRVGAERRTLGRTGVLIYLSLDEHRAEIVADEAITAAVGAERWGAALGAMLAEIREGRLTDGMIAAVERVGKVLAEQFPRAENDINELPDRLIEV